ncbi:MAG: N-acetylneuraminate synthase family protein [Spirochaetales bacterium]|nr:N-acetylneuraminate synthase family protein [Spirochaetales bacterium]
MTPIIIAELGTTHGGSLNRAAELIGRAAETGADYAKVQVVFADDIIHPNTGDVPLPGGKTPLYEVFRKLERELSFYEELRRICQREGIGYLATPFGPKSWEILRHMDEEMVKIASPELNYLPFIQTVSRWQQEKKDRSVILSTGVSLLADIERALSLFPQKDRLTLLHCITSYPAPPEEYNLSLIPLYRSLFGCSVGLSDHSTDPFIVPLTATSVGASMIEKHFCLSHKDGGLDDPIALEADDFSRMVSEVKEAAEFSEEAQRERLKKRLGADGLQIVLGSGKKDLAPAEAAHYGRTNRSLHALTYLPAGTVLTPENTALLRTEKVLRPGLEPKNVPAVLGKKLTRPVESGQGILWDDLLQD